MEEASDRHNDEDEEDREYESSNPTLVEHLEWLQRRLIRRIDKLEEHVMATLQDLLDQVNQLSTEEASLAPAVQAVLTELQTLETQLSQTNLSADDQAKVDAAMANVTTAGQDLVTQLTSLQNASPQTPPTP